MKTPIPKHYINTMTVALVNSTTAMLHDCLTDLQPAEEDKRPLVFVAVGAADFSGVYVDGTVTPENQAQFLRELADQIERGQKLANRNIIIKA